MCDATLRACRRRDMHTRALTSRNTRISTPRCTHTLTYPPHKARHMDIHKPECTRSSCPCLLSVRFTEAMSQFAAYSPADAKGGADIVSKKTALVAIEFQNEFTTEGGKLHGAVAPVMKETDMLTKTAKIADEVRAAGGLVIHVPIKFKADASDNPNKAIGILAGCAKDSLFTENTWNSEFCKEMAPKEGDAVAVGKKGLDAFPNTNLDELLRSKGVETIVLCGFLTNCCVESTMRTACEKGYNVVTLTDCCATTSKEGHDAATTGTFGMFSSPMTAADFGAKLAPAA